MGCSKCKQKNSSSLSKVEIEKMVSRYERYIIIFFMFIGGFTMYGIYSLIKNLL